MNNQKVVGFNKDSALLQVHSIFETIQGEGVYVGYPCTFIRLYGCNLMCPSCDTDYTSVKDEMSIESILSKMGKSELVIITGGEPMNQDISLLVDGLYAQGKVIQLETNGTRHLPDLDYSKVTIMCSPKTSKVHSKLIPHIKAFKYVGGAGNIAEDGLPQHALGYVTKRGLYRGEHTIPIYLQPEDVGCVDKNTENLQACITSCKENGYILGVQLHKIIGED